MALPIVLFGGTPYHIPYAARLRGGANAGFYRTPGATTDRRKNTLSRWFKRGALGTATTLWLGYQNASNYTLLSVLADGRVAFTHRVAGVTVAYVLTTTKLLDPTGHYHVLFHLDTANATASERVKIWLNGALQTLDASGAGYPAQNTDTFLNVSGDPMGFGYEATAVSLPSDGVHAEIVFLDGLLAPLWQFGFVDAGSGAFRPVKFVSAFGGDNSGHYEFKDASAATAGAFGKDTSGKGTNLTPSNVSVTAGINFDQTLDTPTNNMAVLNPLDGDTAHGTVSAAGSSLTAEIYVDNYTPFRASRATNTGKFYLEATADKANTHGNYVFAGWGAVNTLLTGVGAPTPGFSLSWLNSNLSSSIQAGAYSTGAAYGDVLQVAIDFDAGKWWAGANGVWLNAGNPAAGTGHVGTFTANSLFAPFAAAAHGDGSFPNYQSKVDVNFGQRAFAYTAPSGFSAAGIAPPAAAVTSGNFTGSALADGPNLYLGGTPAALTINGNAVTWGTHARKTATGAKIITASSSYNAAGSNSFTATGIVPVQPGRRHFNNAQVT